MPGTLIAMGRLNRPALMIYGGTIKPGHSTINGATLDIVSAFQSYGAPTHAPVQQGLGADASSTPRAHLNHHQCNYRRHALLPRGGPLA